MNEIVHLAIASSQGFDASAEPPLDELAPYDDLMLEVNVRTTANVFEAASRRTRSRGKKFIFQLELIGGPLEAVNSRMGFSYDLKEWIARGLFDEIHARPIPGYSLWMRNVLLPCAKKHGVHVHLATANGTAGYNHSDYLQYERMVSDAILLGYEGVNFYESVNLYDLTEAETIQPRALGEVILRRAAELAARKSPDLARRGNRGPDGGWMGG